jgi:hypothetical protein
MYCSGRSAAALYCILCFEASVVAISVFIGSVSERIRWTSVQLEKLSSFIPSSQYLKNQYVLEDSVLPYQRLGGKPHFKSWGMSVSYLLQE